MTAFHIASGFATATVFSLALVPFLLKLALAYGLYDLPDQAGHVVSSHKFGGVARKVHSSPIPRIGGVAIVLSFFLTGLIWSFGSPIKVPLLASLGVFCLGLADDIYSLSPRLRLGVQLACATGAVVWGGLALPVLSFTSSFHLPLPHWVGVVLAIFVIVGAVNAINMIDGLDGLAGGVVVIGTALLSFVHFVRTQDFYLLLTISIPMIGAILGFLRYNTHPASIFMGDGGSNWLGFMLGVLILVVLGNHSVSEVNNGLALIPASSVQGTTYVPLISAVLCLAIPVFDTACVLVSRIMNGLSPMAPDKRHFHHTLLNLGLSHSQSVSAVYFLSLSAGILGILPVIFKQYNFSWLPYVIALTLLLLIPMSVNASKETIEKLANSRLFWRHHKTLGPNVSSTIRVWENLNRYVLYCILLASPVFAGTIRPQIGYAAGVAFLFIVVVSLSKKGDNDFFESLSISAGAIILLIANNMNLMMIELSGQRISIQFLYNALFIFLFVSTLLLFFVTFKKRYFLFTPSDFLLLMIPMIMLLAPETYKSEYRLDIICLRSLVVFMCVRTMMKRRKQSSYHIRVVTLAALVFVTLTGMWGLRVVY